ncbi:MAG: hypothetical protein J6Q32_02095, partial [Clostridia bacterium]|nr:hypothetical protein [Clostridia bacterium]
YIAYASKTNDNGEIISNDMVFAVESAVANVTIGGVSVPFTTDGSNVVVSSTVLKSNAGVKVITVETYTKKYVINATIGTFGITKLADVAPGLHTLAAWRKAGGATSNNFNVAGSASAGYIVLTTNLVGTGTEMFHDGTQGTSQLGINGNLPIYGFTGTFDGCGYSITNVVVGSNSGWVSGFGLTRSSAVIKNLTLQFATIGKYYQGLFNQFATGTVDNCTFDATANTNATVLGSYIAGLTMIDSTIIVRTGTGTLTDALASQGVHATNSQGSNIGLGATFTNTTLYTEYPVNDAYAGYGLVKKSIAEIPA